MLSRKDGTITSDSTREVSELRSPSQPASLLLLIMNFLNLVGPSLIFWTSSRATVDRDHTTFPPCLGSILERGFDIPKDPFSAEGRQHLLDQHRQLLAMQETEFEKCSETMGEDLRYMGTSTVVRDIEEMSRVLHGKNAKINYHGWVSLCLSLASLPQC